MFERLKAVRGHKNKEILLKKTFGLHEYTCEELH